MLRYMMNVGNILTGRESYPMNFCARIRIVDGRLRKSMDIGMLSILS